jgi:hypothetical protein
MTRSRLKEWILMIILNISIALLIGVALGYAYRGWIAHRVNIAAAKAQADANALKASALAAVVSIDQAVSKAVDEAEVKAIALTEAIKKDL